MIVVSAKFGYSFAASIQSSNINTEFECVHLGQPESITSTKERLTAGDIKRRTRHTISYFCQGKSCDGIHRSASIIVPPNDAAAFLDCLPTSYQQHVRDHGEGQLPLGEYLTMIKIQDLGPVLRMLESHGTGKEIAGRTLADGHMQLSALTGLDTSRSVDGTEGAGSSNHGNELRHGFFKSPKTFSLLPAISFFFLIAGKRAPSIHAP